MKELLKSLATFFAGKNAAGTAIEVDEAKETATLSRADAETLIAEATRAAALEAELTTANESLAAAQSEIAELRTNNGTYATRISAIEQELGIEAGADIIASIQTLKSGPVTGQEVASTGKDKVTTDQAEENPFKGINEHVKNKRAEWGL